MDFLNKMYNKAKTSFNTTNMKQQPQQIQKQQIPIVKTTASYVNLPKVSTKAIQEKNMRKTKLKIVCWNIEDFVSINGLYNSEKVENNPNNQTIENNPKPEVQELFFLNQLRDQDIIMIQEWKNTNYEGDLFLCKLNKRRFKYSHTAVDRVAVIYNTDIFDKNLTITFKIPLFHEAPRTIEKIYTKGRQKYNMLTILFPIDKSKLPICVVNFHLSAYSPEMHSDVHKKQITGLIQTSLEKIKDENIKNYGFVIGGDTNYRTLGENSDDLLNALVSSDYNLPCGNGEGYCGNGVLKDVCNENTCLHTKTQSFKCVHEKGVAKSGVKFLRNNFFSDQSKPSWSFHDNRLDFLATNLLINFNSTKILKLCDLSDHSAILSQMSWQIDNSNAGKEIKQNNKSSNFNFNLNQNMMLGKQPDMSNIQSAGKHKSTKKNKMSKKNNKKNKNKSTKRNNSNRNRK